jgi:hypothetical protein
MVELVVVVTFAVVAAWFVLTREKKELPKSDGTGPGAPECGETVSTIFGPITIPCDKDLNKLTKVKIEELGREHGVELDRRKTKANMIADLKEAVK